MSEWVEEDREAPDVEFLRQAATPPRIYPSQEASNRDAEEPPRVSAKELVGRFVVG